MRWIFWFVFVYFESSRCRAYWFWSLEVGLWVAAIFAIIILGSEQSRWTISKYNRRRLHDFSKQQSRSTMTAHTYTAIESLGNRRMFCIYFNRHLNCLLLTHTAISMHFSGWIAIGLNGLAHRRIGRPVTMKIDQGQRANLFSQYVWRVWGRKIHKTRRICVWFFIHLILRSSGERLDQNEVIFPHVGMAVWDNAISVELNDLFYGHYAMNAP